MRSSSAGPTLLWCSPRNVFVARKTSTAAGAGGAAAARGARGASMPRRVALPRTSYTVCLGHHSFTTAPPSAPCPSSVPRSCRRASRGLRPCQPRWQGALAVQVTFTAGKPAAAFGQEAPRGCPSRRSPSQTTCVRAEAVRAGQLASDAAGHCRVHRGRERGAGGGGHPERGRSAAQQPQAADPERRARGHRRGDVVHLAAG